MIDNRKIRNIIYNENIASIYKEFSELWKIDAYYNDRGNQINRFLPSNFIGEKDIGSFYSFNILLTRFSKARKSTFINLIAKKLIANESAKAESDTQKITEYYLTLNHKIQNMAIIKLIDSPGLIIEDKKKDYNQESVINCIKN